jgi:hypothetical protein
VNRRTGVEPRPVAQHRPQDVDTSASGEALEVPTLLIGNSSKLTMPSRDTRTKVSCISYDW